MAFTGTIINFVGVLVIGILGSFVKKGIPKRITDTLIAAMAICVIFIGIDGVLEAAPAISKIKSFSDGLVKVLVMIISMAIGTLIGELIDIDKQITRLGDFFETKFTSGKDAKKGNFAKGFVSCSILFCVGAMAVNGGIEDGMGNPEILIAKTVIDCITCFIMATTLGIGCAFSAFTLLIYQGAFALLGFALSSAIPAATMSYMSVVGSLIIILIGTNMLGATKVKTANMIPAMFIPLLLTPLFTLVVG